MYTLLSGNSSVLALLSISFSTRNVACLYDWQEEKKPNQTTTEHVHMAAAFRE